MFSDWQRKLDRVPIRFAILYIQLLLWLYVLSPTVLMSISWLLCHMLWPWPVTPCVMWPFCDCCHTFVTLWLVIWYLSMLYLNNKRKEKETLNNDLAILLSHNILRGLGGFICGGPCPYLIGNPPISFVNSTNVCPCECMRVFILSRAPCILFLWCSHNLSCFLYNVFNTLISCCKASMSRYALTFLTDSSLL